MNKPVISYSLCFSFLVAILVGVTQQTNPLSILIPLGENQDFQALQTEVAEKVNRIISDELAATSTKKRVNFHYPEFKIQNEPHITLLFDRTVHENFEQSSVLALQVMQSLGKGRSITGNIELISEADLFGFHNEFLVMKVRDESNVLLGLRNDIKASLRWLDRYAQESDSADYGWLNPVYKFGLWIKSFFVPTKVQRSIFDGAKWDAYPFSPHVTVGMLPRQEIFKIASWNHADSKQVWECIKKRIRLEILPLIKEAQFERELTLTVFNVMSKNYTMLHEFPCEHRLENKHMTPIIDTV